jgi:hypothetical protein
MDKRNNGDIILSFAAFFQIVVLMFQELLTNSNIVSHDDSRLVCILVSALPMVMAIYYIIKRRLLLFLYTYLIIIFLILSTYIFYPDNEKYLNRGTFNILFVNLPCLLCLASIRNIEILKRIMLYLSYVVLLLGITYLLLLWIGKITFSEYSMTFSYYLLLPALIFISQKKVIFTYIFILVCIIMLMLGSRGALVTSLIYALFLFFMDRNNRRNILLVSIVLVIVVASGTFLSLFFKLTNNMSVTSRTLDLLLGGDIAQDTGRVGIYSIIWNNILTDPLAGYGIFGDRIILDGIYCHNFFLEIFCNFGLILGSGLILLLAITIFRAFRVSDFENKKLLLMLFCYTFIPLMVSLSYLTFPQIAIFIGFLCTLLKNNQYD